jgi:protease-4
VAKNKKVKALVLRIDSPGGSAVASDSIWRELVRVKAAGKPIVVSMGGVAASGGYYMAVAADRVLAQPATITGSVGVISAQFILADAKAKLSINPAEVHTGAEPTQFSVNRLPSAAQRARGQAQIDSVYELFRTRVAEGRDLPVERVEEVAKGRVWTGADAAAIGLVDELGGLQRSLDVAVELCGQDPKTSRAVVRPFPKRSNMLSQLRSKGGDSSEDAARIRLPTLDELTRPGLLCHLGRDARSYWIH